MLTISLEPTAQGDVKDLPLTFSELEEQNNFL